MKYDTENYVIQEGTGSWRNHANVNILDSYSEHIFGDVLDIGCNTGGVTYWLHTNSKVKSITGIDINYMVEDIFKKHMKNLSIKIEFVTGNYVEECSLKNRLFDTIVSFHTLEHIYPTDVSKFTNNIASNLKSGGKFVVSLPYDRAYKDDHHRAFYDEFSLKTLMEKSGLKCTECFNDKRWKEANLLTGLFEKL